MRQSIEELLAVVYKYYARGVQPGEPGYKETVEHRRLVQARMQAGREGNPGSLLRQHLHKRLPTSKLQNNSLHLPTGKHDACYSCWLWLESREHQEKSHRLGFLVSFLVPCYIVYSSAVVASPGSAPPGWEHKISFSFSVDEQYFAQIIAEEILSVFPGYEPMPPEIGNIIVPDVAAGLKRLGEATIFDCLFTDYR